MAGKGSTTLMEGPLLKKADGATGLMMGWRERRFVLTCAELAYFEPRSTAPKGTMQLSQVRRIEEIPEKKSGKRFCFSISSSSTTWMVRADTQADFERWHGEIKEAVQAACKGPLLSTMPPPSPAATNTSGYNRTSVDSSNQGESFLGGSTPTTGRNSGSILDASMRSNNNADTSRASNRRVSKDELNSTMASSGGGRSSANLDLSSGSRAGDRGGGGGLGHKKQGEQPPSSRPPSGKPPLSGSGSGSGGGIGLAGLRQAGPIVTDLYSLGRVIDRGANGEVMEAKDKRTGERVAIKRVEVGCSNEGEDQMEIWQQVQHKSVVRLLDFFKTDKNLYFVMELASGRDLFYAVTRLYEGNVPRGFSERDAVNITSQVVQALRHLHLRRIVHCDLKPENILVADADEWGDAGGGGDELRIKLADWGFAQVISPHKSLDKVLGTGAYMAPEMLARHTYDEKVDVWSAGVIFYVLLCGFPPYNATYDRANRLNLDGTLESILEKTRDGAWDWFPSPYWDAVSPEAKAFVRSLLTVDPMLRPSAEQCLKADWYSSLLPLPKASGAGQQQVSGESLPGLREQLQKLNASRARTAIEHCLGGALGHTRSGAAIVGPALSADIGGDGGADKDFILEELGWQPLISLAWSGDDEDRKIAATGLANASANKSQMQALVREGGLRVLTDIAASCDSDIVLHPVAIALHNIASVPENREPLFRAGAHTRLLAVARRSSTACRYQAARCLAKLALHPPAQEELVSAGVMTPLIELVRQELFEAMRDDAVKGILALASHRLLKKVVLTAVMQSTAKDGGEGDLHVKELWDKMQAGGGAGEAAVGGGNTWVGGSDDSLRSGDSMASMVGHNTAIKVQGAGGGAAVSEWDVSLADLSEAEPKVVRSGASASVHKMKIVKTGRVVAVKFVALALMESERRQLLKEINGSFSCGLKPHDPIRDPKKSHVIGFYGALYDAGSKRLGIVMDYCDGGNVKELYRAAQWGSKGGKGSVMSEGCISSLMYQVAEALNFMHSQHLIHRDIKPSSLLVSSSGLVSVTNLGNLRKIAKTTGQAASVVGSTCYMSPERIVGVHFTNSADIWGLGLTVLECVCGGYPFEQHQHNYMALLEHIVQSPCPVDLVEPSDLPAGLADVLRLCLDKVASKRPTARQLLDMEFVSSGKKAQEELANLVGALLGGAADKGDPQMSPTGTGDASPPHNKKPGLTPLGGIPV